MIIILHLNTIFILIELIFQDQDPAALGKDVAAASKQIIQVRYTLLPFLYSLFYQVNQQGGTVVRSLIHEFPTDKRCLNIDRQFMWGSWLLISPVLDANKRSVYAYFPKTRWFDFYSGKEITQTGRVHELDAPLDHIPLHVRGGAMILTQEHGKNTDESRKNPYGLIVGLDETETGEFKTNLFMDEGGDHIDYIDKSSEFEFTYKVSSKVHQLTIKNIRLNLQMFEGNKFETLRVLGVESEPRTIEVVIGKDSSAGYFSFEYNNDSKELLVRSLGIILTKSTAFVRITLT